MRAIELAPEDPDRHFARADALFSGPRLEPAIEDYTTRVGRVPERAARVAARDRRSGTGDRLEPDVADACESRGLACRQAQDHTRAIVQEHLDILA